MSESHHTDLCFHFVGARGGNAMLLPQTFERDLTCVFYDADPDCLEQLEGLYRQRSFRYHVAPHCLGGKDGPAFFHINYDPYTSSLHALNPRYASFYFTTREGYDYVFGDTAATVEKRQIDLITLDTLMQKEKCFPPPDFLLADIQGAEFELFQGGAATLGRHTLGIQAEVAFHPLYENQKLFGDLSRQLTELGFSFITFPTLHDPLAPCRGPSGFRGQGFLVSGDALFLKKPEHIEANAAGLSLEEVYGQMRKLAFLAILFQQYEYASDILKRSHDLLARLPGYQEPAGSAYLEFLRELEDILNRDSGRMLPTFPQIYSFEASKARFAASTPPASTRKSLTSSLKRLPLVFKTLKAARDLAHASVEQVHSYLREFRPSSEVESLLCRWGFVDQAALLKHRRLAA